MKYIKQLDSIRAIAVLLVIVEHWLPRLSFNQRIPYGEFGVDTFFVLSGFLISGILLQNRASVDKGIQTRGFVLKSFYVRRSLRIFPIYYLVIFTALLFAPYTFSHIKEAFPWYATYTANWFMFSNGWDGYLSHLWSLAVEEQFYLIWPWLLLLIRKEWLPWTIGLFILTGITSNYLLVNQSMGTVLTFTWFDSFGMGALLAWLQHRGEDQVKRFYPTFTTAAIVSAILLVFGMWRLKYDLLPLRTLVSLVALWLLAYIVLIKEEAKFIGKAVLNNHVLIFLGKISYGIYIYHNLVPLLNEHTLSKWLDPHLPIFISGHKEKIHFFENCILLVLIAWGSFNLIEKRFLGLKKYFEYR